MFFSFIIFCLSGKRPVILVPGLMGSMLNGDITGHRYWYCSNEKDNNIWFNDKYIIPPLYNCLFDYIHLEWDGEKNEPTQPNYVNITIVDFGGINGINTVDTIFYDKHILPYYKIMIDKLQDNGFVVGDTIFGAPFDWRFGVYQSDSFWQQMIELVEKVYNQNKKRVVLLGHSMGCYLLNVMLTQKTTKQWREKYVDSSIYVAPSFGGAGLAFSSLWTKKIPFLEIIGEYPETIDTLMGLHIHMQNEELWGDKVVSIGLNGENLTAKNLTKYLLDNGKLDENSYKIYQKSEPFFKHLPQESDVQTAIIYNSGLISLEGLDLREGKDIPLYGSGDLIVNEEGPMWACSTWKNITCKDLDSINPVDNHLTMLYRDSVNDFVIDWLNRA